jgi:hypothetical protein
MVPSERDVSETAFHFRKGGVHEIATLLLLPDKNEVFFGTLIISIYTIIVAASVKRLKKRKGFFKIFFVFSEVDKVIIGFEVRPPLVLLSPKSD